MNDTEKYNFTEQIQKAALVLKEDNDLISNTDEISEAIANWLEDQLSDISWLYKNRNDLALRHEIEASEKEAAFIIFSNNKDCLKALNSSPITGEDKS